MSVMESNDRAQRAPRKLAKVWTMLAEVLAPLVSGEQESAVVRDKFDECAAECLAEFDDAELRDSLETQIQLVRNLVFMEAGDVVGMRARVLPAHSPKREHKR
ncbi:MAG: hypothetical protein OXR82_06495 [Gammaproteobacteria bacterium]|nr:hypothetical protein [Gammaproteobacteria bacterium]MDE0258023.1 hypothetical protein [Gammaproteobacteria bacterium]